MTNSVLITAAINGAETTREQNPGLPLTPEEVACEARRCVEEGAAIVHLHARQPDGTPSQDMDIFRDYFDAIRDVTDVIVQFSTGGALGMDLEERITALSLRPEMATVTTGSVNFGEDVFVNRASDVREILARMKQFGVRPEIEIFEIGMLDFALRLRDEGLLTGSQHVDFVLGVPGAMAARAGHLRYAMGLLPEDWTWSVAGIGRFEFPMAELALREGGHVRVGLEDNIYLEKGVLAEGSHALVRKIRKMASDAGRQPMSIEEARKLLRCDEVRYASG